MKRLPVSLPKDGVISATIHELKTGEESLYIVQDLGASPQQLRELSFSGVWSVYRHFLQGIEVSDSSQWAARLERALHYASQHKLPKRPGRSYPREAYARRSKTTHFQKRKKPDKPNELNETATK